ncbi:MAG: GntR family transcriptional regulator [Kordiimonadaceae bacterium]|nr:GntR family transcriptional regulator [Kordiimonadaceae bacterium]
MTETKINEFHKDIARQVIEYCERSGLKIADRITERNIGKELGVSRSPVRAAFSLLVKFDIIEHMPNSGYKLKVEGDELFARFKDDAPSEFDQLYERILKDRFAEEIPQHLSERDCMRRYDVTRGQLMKVFLRLSNEGLIHRGQGHGWSFVEMLVTPEAYVSSYELRLTIEPAGLLMAGFKVDKDQLDRCYKKHVKILKAGFDKVTCAQMSELDAELHELLMSFTCNPYFLNVIQHQNSLRRVVEYQSFYLDERTEDSCREHIEILEALRHDRKELASTLLMRHLQLASEAQRTFE